MSNNTNVLFDCYPFHSDSQYTECRDTKTISACCYWESATRISLEKTLSNITLLYNKTRQEFEVPTAGSPFITCNSNASNISEYFNEILNVSQKPCYDDTLRSMSLIAAIGAVINGLVFVVGSIFNCSVLMVLCWNRSLWQPLNLYIVSTLLADQIMVFFVIPIQIMNWYKSYYWTFGETICKLWHGTFFMCYTVAAYTATAISVERFIIIVNCFQSRGRSSSSRTKRRTIIVNICVWLFGMLWSVPALVTGYVCRDSKTCFYFHDKKHGVMYRHYNHNTQLFTLFIIPFSTIAVFYIITFFNLRTTSKLVANESRSNQSEIKSREKINKLFIAIIVTFFLCHIPRNIWLLIDGSVNFSAPRSLAQFHAFYKVTLFPFNLNFCLNSIIILLMSVKIRTQFYQLYGAKIKNKSLGSVNSNTTETESLPSIQDSIRIKNIYETQNFTKVLNVPAFPIENLKDNMSDKFPTIENKSVSGIVTIREQMLNAPSVPENETPSCSFNTMEITHM